MVLTNSGSPTCTENLLPPPLSDFFTRWGVSFDELLGSLIYSPPAASGFSGPSPQ